PDRQAAGVTLSREAAAGASGAPGPGVLLEQKARPACLQTPPAAPTPADTGSNPLSPPFPGVRNQESEQGPFLTLTPVVQPGELLSDYDTARSPRQGPGPNRSPAGPADEATVCPARPARRPVRENRFG